MYKQVLDFWFDDIDPSQWWVKDVKFDQEIKDKFLSIHTQANLGELFHWRNTAQGRLAEIIVLDQFSRNIFRDTPMSFSSDSLALILAQEAINVGADKELSTAQCSFLYMPFMHSESAVIHEVAVQLFTQNGSQSNLDFELKHQAIIQQFGRYPHRNDILGRESTIQEREFLTQPGSSF